MEIAAEVRRGNVKRPRSVKLEHLKLKFEDKKAKVKVTREQAAEWAKARWLGMMTAPVIKMVQDSDNSVIVSAF